MVWIWMIMPHTPIGVYGWEIWENNGGGEFTTLSTTGQAHLGQHRPGRTRNGWEDTNTLGDGGETFSSASFFFSY